MNIFIEMLKNIFCYIILDFFYKVAMNVVLTQTKECAETAMNVVLILPIPAY